MQWFALLVPDLGLVQVFARGVGPGPSTALYQVVTIGGKNRLVPARVSTAMRPFLHLMGRPPLLVDPEPLADAPGLTTCVYCGSKSVIEEGLTGFSLPSYIPKGSTCGVCGKATIYL